MYDNDRMGAMLRHADIPTALRLRDGRVEGRRDISGISALCHLWPRQGMLQGESVAPHTRHAHYAVRALPIREEDTAWRAERIRWR